METWEICNASRHPSHQAHLLHSGEKSDFLLPALVAGSHGVIAASANAVPALHAELYKNYQDGNLVAAQAFQVKLSHAEDAWMK